MKDALTPLDTNASKPFNNGSATENLKACGLLEEIIEEGLQAQGTSKFGASKENQESFSLFGSKKNMSSQKKAESHQRNRYDVVSENTTPYKSQNGGAQKSHEVSKNDRSFHKID